MHLIMYYAKLFNINIYPCSCSWGCLPGCLVLVASSSPIGGSGTLQIGIRALEGHEKLVNKGRVPTAQKKTGENSKKFVSPKIIG